MPCHAAAGRVRKSPSTILSCAMHGDGCAPNMLQACAPWFWSLHVPALLQAQPVQQERTFVPDFEFMVLGANSCHKRNFVGCGFKGWPWVLGLLANRCAGGLRHPDSKVRILLPQTFFHWHQALISLVLRSQDELLLGKRNLKNQKHKNSCYSTDLTCELQTKFWNLPHIWIDNIKIHVFPLLWFQEHW